MRILITSTMAVAALLALPAAAQTSFSGNTVNLVGNATVLSNGDLQLTDGGSNSTYESGAAWLTTPFSTSSSFTANYSFSLAQTTANPMADGVAFVMQNGGTSAIGYNGGNVGYTGLNGVGSIVQSWVNNTAGLNIDGNAYNTKAAPANLGAAALVLGNETVSYNAGTNLLSMNGTLVVDGVSYKISDTATVNLSKTFGSTMELGFTGATGGSFADERITNFSVSAVPEPQTYGMMLAGLGMLAFTMRRKAK